MIPIPGLRPDEDEFGYEGDLLLTAWKGFQSRNGPYCSLDSELPSEGKCLLYVMPEEEEENWEVGAHQERAYHYLVKHQEAIKERILEAILAEYERLRELYGYTPEEQAAYMPDVEHTEDFKKLLGLSIVHIIDAEKEGQSYVGFEFGCTWDDEHGLGVMTHQDCIVKIGGADTAFLSWIAEWDKKG